MSPQQEVVHELLPARGDPAGALVLLHGRGSDEHDLVPLAHALDPARRLVGLLPRGPLSLPPGGAHWYAVARVGFPEPATFHETYSLLARFYDGLEALTGVPMQRTILGGFSQGSVMSYALGLGKDRPSPGGILALSGFIPTVHDFELDLSDRAGLPVLIAHGARDPVIDVEFGRDAQRRLSEAGLAVEYHESPAGHHIDPRALQLIADWVARVIGPGAAAPAS